jgi:23S rRNA pseudouridine1911/1915/1917 synthase
MSKSIQEQHIVPAHCSGKRLDQVATQLFNDYSRSRIQEWIRQGAVTIDGRQCRPRDKLHGGEQLVLSATLDDDERWEPQDIPLNVLYQDEDIIVLNKPAGLVVHPGAGVANGTLLNSLLFHYPDLSALPRAGIVHRLDKDTSGIMVVARSLLAHASLVQQLQNRSLGREYEAVVMGELTGGGVVDKPIGRHPTHRVKMAVLEHKSSAKEATTHYRLLKRFQGYTHIACRLETGRTHQIRVHMAHIKHPLVGDPVYANRQRWVAGTSLSLQNVLKAFSRQALHARRLTLIHPKTQETRCWQITIPDDMQNLLVQLSKEADAGDKEGTW